MKTPKMKYRIAALLLALMLLVLGGCGAAPEQTVKPTAETETQEEAKIPGSVTVTGEAAAGLTEGQQTVIVAFMERDKAAHRSGVQHRGGAAYFGEGKSCGPAGTAGAAGGADVGPECL